jgi:citrate lyase beta subunit
MLARIQSFPGIHRLAGFVLPKVTASNLPEYLACVNDRHLLMPTLETREVLDHAQMRRLRRQLLSIKERIVALRIGGNDLLQTIGARRSAMRTAYDGPLGYMVASLVTAFAPYGFALSAPVFEHFENAALLREEVERDMEHGLYTKTAIHPAQVAAIQALYAVDVEDLAEARAVLCDQSRAVFGSRGSMCEPMTHQRWANAIIRRSEAFGIRPGSAIAAATG